MHLSAASERITNPEPPVSNFEEFRLAKACIRLWLKCRGTELSLIYTLAFTCRSAAVDSGGKEINRNRLIALLSAIILSEHPGTTIVTDSVTSDGLTEFIEKLGRLHIRPAVALLLALKTGWKLRTPMGFGTPGEEP